MPCQHIHSERGGEGPLAFSGKDAEESARVDGQGGRVRCQKTSLLDPAQAVYRNNSVAIPNVVRMASTQALMVVSSRAILS
jgi:hypothetical protein